MQQQHTPPAQPRGGADTPVDRNPNRDHPIPKDPARTLVDRLESAVGSDKLDRYLSEAHALLRVTDHKVEVTAPSAFIAQMIDRQLGDEIRRLAKQADPGATVSFRVDVDAFGRDEPAAAAPGRDTARQSPGAPDRPGAPSTAGRDADIVRGPSRRRAAPARRPRPQDDEHYALSSFVVGESNRLAHSAAMRIATGEGRSEFSPLVVHGPCGVGKTHLLRGVAALRRRTAPGCRIKYTTAEAFTNAFVVALKRGKLEDFRKSYRGLDLLCIDDIHFLARKVQTQSELLHTLDEIRAGGACIVLASDAHPRQVAELAEALKSRLLSGAVVRIDPPDRELQAALIRGMCARRGIAIAPEALELVIGRAARLAAVTGSVSVRDLEGLVTQIDAVRKLLPELKSPDGVVGIVLARRALGLDGGAGAPGAKARRPVPLEFIRKEVAKRLAISEAELLGKGRHKRVVLGRALIVSTARRMTTHSFPEIGRALGRVNHSTVVTAHQRITGQAERGEIVRAGSDYDGLTYAEAMDQVERDVRKASLGG